MAAAPRYKVYDAAGNYQGCAKDPVLAAVMADWLPTPSTVRVSHSPKDTVFTTSEDAIDSYDAVEIAIAEAEEALRANRRTP